MFLTLYPDYQSDFANFSQNLNEVLSTGFTNFYEWHESQEEFLEAHEA